MPIPGEGVCYGGDNGRPMTLTTNLLDSHKDLGINAAQQDRLTIQYQTTCAPLDYDFVDSYTYLYNETSPWWPHRNTTVEYYQMGNSTQSDGTPDNLYVYSPTIRYWGIGTAGYFLNPYQSLAPHTGEYSSWTPVAPFNSTVGDLTLFFLAPNGITFTAPVQDPMFQTFTQPDPNVSGGAPYVTNRTNYLLACSETWQVCNPVKDRCTGWTTAAAFANTTSQSDWATALDLNPAQNATWWRIGSIPSNANMQSATHGVPNPLLAATYARSNTGSQPVPDGFWRTEVEGWFQAVLAKMQLIQTVFVDVPGDIVDANHIQIVPARNLSIELAKQCAQQRIAAPPQYQSYNVFALVLIAVVGIVVIGVAAGLRLGNEHLPGARKHGYRFLSYEAEALLSLHRMALEGAGVTGWVAGKNGTPRTRQASRRVPQAVTGRGAGDDGCQAGSGLMRYPASKGEEVSVSGGGIEMGRRGYRKLAVEDGL